MNIFFCLSYSLLSPLSLTLSLHLIPSNVVLSARKKSKSEQWFPVPPTNDARFKWLFFRETIRAIARRRFRNVDPPISFSSRHQRFAFFLSFFLATIIVTDVCSIWTRNRDSTMLQRLTIRLTTAIIKINYLFAQLNLISFDCVAWFMNDGMCKPPVWGQFYDVLCVEVVISLSNFNVVIKEDSWGMLCKSSIVFALITFRLIRG